MTEEQRLILKLIAGMLDYPGHPEFWHRMEERENLAQELNDTLRNVFRAFHGTTPLELEKLYVKSFDFDEAGCLYMTFYELADSRARGEALISLSELYQKAGYEVPENQLPDFLPLLLEFVALEPLHADQALLQRIARAAAGIARHLEPSHLYYPLLGLIADTLGYKEIQASSAPSETPDDIDLPYPIDY